eukprot:GHRR01022875.1.p1 GENE.GHRR01022875.1~~GHRR01022875.1.p1  ORF type:complete len:1033 (+),score=433.02 GHRR01022875.1:114-3212(+)
MAENSNTPELSGIQVCVRVRPLNDRERDAGYRNCISFDEATRQVVLEAVDRTTLAHLRGQGAKGYAFDRRYGPEHISDNIYADCVSQLVDNLFKGYNGTVLAYGQTGTGKTLTMSGGKGIFSNQDTGIIRLAAEHIFRNVEGVKAKLKPGESISIKAYALELYNEELRDLSSNVSPAAADRDAEGKGSWGEGVRIAERSAGRSGIMTVEVVGANTVEVTDAASLIKFFADCFDNRAVGETKMNARSSRSHAIYTVLINRTLVDVSDGGDKVRTVCVESRFNLVDLAGSERVKRSGVTGAAFKEAVNINGGLLALGNVIVALSAGHEEGDASSSETASAAAPAVAAAKQQARKHIPYRDSKLTRLLQDSLGGNALTVLISCISCCEADFEETNSTLKYANRACKIKNSPLPNKQLLLEEDLLPLMPGSAGGAAANGQMSNVQMQLLLAEHARMREAKDRREAERREKEEKRLAELRAMKESESKSPGFQRLRMAQYDELRKKLTGSHGGKLGKGEIIADETLAGFKKPATPDSDGSAAGDVPSYMRPTTASRTSSPATGVKSSSRMSGGKVQHARHVRTNTTGSNPWDSHDSRPHSPNILSLETDPPAAEAAATAAAEAVAASRDESHLGKEFTDAADGFAEVDGVSGDNLPLAGLNLDVPGEQKQTSTGDGSCMPPHDGSPTIKACYEPDSLEAQDPTGAADDATETAGATTAGLQAAASKGHAAAFDVLAFQPQQQQEPPHGVPSDQAVPDSALLDAVPPPQLLARFRVNHDDTLSVFRAVSPEDFADVAGLLPSNTALPAADKMTYLVARLEIRPYTGDELSAALDIVAAGTMSLNAAVGPAVGCLMATFGTSLINDCIYDFETPEQLAETVLNQRLELWGLQIPHTAVRPALPVDENRSTMTPSPASRSASPDVGTTSSSPQLTPRRSSTTMPNTGSPVRNSTNSSNTTAGARNSPRSSSNQPEQQQVAAAAGQAQGEAATWSSTDRLNVSIGLLYALCNLAAEVGAVAGLCVPRPQLLRRWLQVGHAV